ncbi:uncharacterized protein GVI51_D04015 [Nakaseomyces glabratus]|uniref:Transcriptional regulatory protein HAH1 n=1 Tax=Candida glabrata (strain ATCC 2001 / BCRC 20586 / JCM 3761 / NBRC 0622 / NRRL Y-65 / CBS 138) TaxID=284593 RepID=Q6FW01_CANGA|nr:uncharacterized protein CAGL0D04070g [Nakaseomyces glabratus]KAH7608040.1 Transcriptional regulator [Nakaseomyces glabratus]KAH7608446.1 Transcriptional regulator [Nakaseomyces glabratus]KTB10621.1 putative transcriptional regulatory protein HAH1 [Nakaseomyces glabratus]KTB26861.1 putative transcriptional regulatory protein HAH1 [Nakaseomyces glabratus]QHS65227.1 uncharacterized protein GVI51_D04015 [Nakaseomyces glabratus]|eukprot:XP_445593.1 uncharacterized protein CAGL0D04070g [[Candida] glabrata]
MLRCSTSRVLSVLESPCASRLPTRTFSHARVMLSGHNKWSTIKHDKAKNDAEKNKLINKFASQVTIAVKSGGSGDPAMNIRLQSAIDLAFKNNVPKKVIEGAINRGLGIGGEKNSSEVCVYEGIGPGGVAYVVECLTDNKNRSIALVRSAFNKIGGSMTPTLYFFERKGYLVVESPKELTSEDDVLDAVLEIDGVEDIKLVEEEESNVSDTDEEPGAKYDVITEVQMNNKAANAFKEKGFKIHEMGLEYIPNPDTTVQVTDEEVLAKIEKLTNTLEELDDVTSVYTNISE